ncbi:hypothetical protein quinque_001912 [Culex quinquefasciatus]
MLLQVSWVRHRDIHLLTVGRYTYTSDQRFRAIHHPHTEDWSLQIKYPQHRDSGIYECQISTTPHMSHFVHLNVIEPSTEIIGAPDLYIESGSTINLTCVVKDSPEPPAYIFWNHNNVIISYDSPRGGVSVITEKGDTTTSFLLIQSARPSDSGQYTCNPSNAKSKSVTVHVLNEEDQLERTEARGRVKVIHVTGTCGPCDQPICTLLNRRAATGIGCGIQTSVFGQSVCLRTREKRHLPLAAAERERTVARDPGWCTWTTNWRAADAYRARHVEQRVSGHVGKRTKPASLRRRRASRSARVDARDHPAEPEQASRPVLVVAFLEVPRTHRK